MNKVNQKGVKENWDYVKSVADDLLLTATQNKGNFLASNSKEKNVNQK